MTCLGRISLVGIALLVYTVDSRADMKQIRGTVVRAGKPVADAELATHWQIRGDALEPDRPILLDQRGAFDTKLEFSQVPRVLLAYDSARKFAGLAVIREEDADRPVRIELGPVIRVKGTFFCPGLGAKLENLSVSLLVAGDQPLAAVSGNVSGAALDVALPAGVYILAASSRETEWLERKLTLTLSQRVTNLGRIELEPTVLAKHSGKPPPPIYVTDARGVPKAVKLSDYKGKWVLLEFWGYW